MAQYRQQSGIHNNNHLDYVTTTANNHHLNHHHYSNGIGGAAASSAVSEQVSVGVRLPQLKQPRHHHRRLGHSKRRISIGTVITLLCFVLAASAFAYVFLSRDHHTSDISSREPLDDAFKDDFLDNVTRYNTKVKFGHGSVAHGRDSRYWDGDDRRRDDDYNEDVYKSNADNDNEAGKGHGSSGFKSPAKKPKGHLSKNTDHRDLYNEAGRDELKIYEEKYEASLKNVGQAGVETEDENHVLDGGNSDMDSEDVEGDDEYDDGIDSHDSHIDDYDDSKHETETDSKLPKSHSEDSRNDFGKGHETIVDYDSSKDSSTKLQSGKNKQASGADARSNSNSVKQPKKHRKRRKFSSSCDMKLLNSTAQLVEPLESRKFARFSLSYTDREEKPDGVDFWEPRFAGHQGLREREDSFLARDQKINCGFVKGPKEYSSTGFDLAEDDYRYISKCHIAVVSCIFGNSDRLRSPFVKVISRLSRKNVCFVMFMDEKTLRTITLEGQIPDRMGFIGLWKIVVVKNLPFTDMRRVGKIPKLLSHRLFPSARYSIWLDSKLRLQRDPLLLLEHFLWRKGHEYAISNHYDRHCVWEEVERNKKLNKFNHTMIDQQFQFYQADGLKRFNASDPGKLLPSNVPEGSLIIRAHTPMSNLFSCLWFNEVDRFTPRDQLSFAYTYQKLKKKNPSKTFYLHMFKDCERRQIAKLFRHRSEEKRGSSQDATE